MITGGFGQKMIFAHPLDREFWKRAIADICSGFSLD
jgi:hypothetical protein